MTQLSSGHPTSAKRNYAIAILLLVLLCLFAFSRGSEPAPSHMRSQNSITQADARWYLGKSMEEIQGKVGTPDESVSGEHNVWIYKRHSYNGYAAKVFFEFRNEVCVTWSYSLNTSGKTHQELLDMCASITAYNRRRYRLVNHEELLPEGVDAQTNIKDIKRMENGAYRIVSSYVATDFQATISLHNWDHDMKLVVIFHNEV